MELWTKGLPENQWSGLMKRVGCLGEGSFTWTKEEQGLSRGLERSSVQQAPQPSILVYCTVDTNRHRLACMCTHSDASTHTLSCM